MKFILAAATLLVAVLGALVVVTSESTVSAPMSSGADDSSMKTLKID
jgi:hypothetical protein